MKPITDTKTVEVKKPTKKSMLADAAMMECKRDEKVEEALDRLCEQCKTMSQQFNTANGVLEMIHLMDETGLFGVQSDTRLGKGFAQYASQQSMSMCMSVSDRIKRIDENKKNTFDELKTLEEVVDNFFDSSFAHSDKSFSPSELVEQLIKLRICQKVGPAVQDMLDFYNSATEEIENTRKEAKEL